MSRIDKDFKFSAFIFKSVLSTRNVQCHLRGMKGRLFSLIKLQVLSLQITVIMDNSESYVF